jgi:hypothetical protein
MSFGWKPKIGSNISKLYEDVNKPQRDSFFEELYEGCGDKKKLEEMDKPLNPDDEYESDLEDEYESDLESDPDTKKIEEGTNDKIINDIIDELVQSDAIVKGKENIVRIAIGDLMSGQLEGKDYQNKLENENDIQMSVEKGIKDGLGVETEVEETDPNPDNLPDEPQEMYKSKISSGLTTKRKNRTNIQNKNLKIKVGDKVIDTSDRKQREALEDLLGLKRN